MKYLINNATLGDEAPWVALQNEIVYYSGSNNSTISFTVTNLGVTITYYADKGMTWEEWLDSKYNDEYAKKHELYESKPNFVLFVGDNDYTYSNVLQLENKDIISNELIILNANYITEEKILVNPDL